MPLPYPAAPIPRPRSRRQGGATAVISCRREPSASRVTPRISPRTTSSSPNGRLGYLGGGNAMPDMNGRIVKTANITPEPETGIGKWSEDEFVRLLRFGVRPDLTRHRVPDGAVPGAVRRRRASDLRLPAHGAPDQERRGPHARHGVLGPDVGRAAFYRYGCNGCHGDTGVGLYDLRKGATDFPTDEELIAYIRHPGNQEARREDADLGRRDRGGGLRASGRLCPAAGERFPTRRRDRRADAS